MERLCPAMAHWAAEGQGRIILFGKDLSNSIHDRSVYKSCLLRSVSDGGSRL